MHKRILHRRVIILTFVSYDLGGINKGEMSIH